MQQTDKDYKESIATYKQCLSEGHIQRAYIALTKYVAELKNDFPSEYKTGNISLGHMDYTYFPFFNEYLREKKLRFGIVLNNKEMQFELWLMGQNAAVQAHYWEILKASVWNEGVGKMPTYSVLEAHLADIVDFSKKDEMTTAILGKAMSLSVEIEAFIKTKQ